MKRNFREDFPIFAKYPEMSYLDNAATTQRPRQVLEAVNKFYNEANANPLRGVYELSVKATDEYENAREKAARLINAADSSEIIFTRNTTESLNLIAYTYGLANLHEGDEIVITMMEHHSNILPWQMVCKHTGAKLIYMVPDKEGKISDAEIESKITSKAKIVSIGHVSNVMGVVNPVEKVIKKAHSVGAVAIVDGAQSTPHMKVDVRAMDVDFFAFSGHKMLAPMGIGVLYGKKALLENMPPFLSGGEMIEYVEEQSATFAEVPHKFEAGTVNAGGAVGLGAAIDYLNEVGFDYIEEREAALVKRMMEGMAELPYIHVIGGQKPEEHHGIVTFMVDDVHPHDVATILDSQKVCIRAGHHCAQPLLHFLGVNATDRASVYFYNTEDEVDKCITALKNVRGYLGYGA